MNSVNTNVGAMVALQNLNKTSSDLATVQTRINTGLKVASAKDNGAIWAIAQNQRSESGALNAVKESLQRSIDPRRRGPVLGRRAGRAGLQLLRRRRRLPDLRRHLRTERRRHIPRDHGHAGLQPGHRRLGAERRPQRSIARFEKATGDRPGGADRHFCVPE